MKFLETIAVSTVRSALSNKLLLGFIALDMSIVWAGLVLRYLPKDEELKIIYDIGMSAAHHGVKKLVILNGHGGNTPALQFAAQMINRDTSIFTCVESGETSDADISTLIETPNDVHAGEIETSTAFAVRPESVRADEMRKFVPKFSSRFLDFSSKRSVEWYARTVKISQTGVLGDPTKANPQKGERIWSIRVLGLAGPHTILLGRNPLP